MNERRVISIDVIRGFALFGILVMNIQAFALPSAAYFNPIVYGDFSGLNEAVWVLTRLFFDVKFLSIFSTLFGASLVLAGGGQPGTRRLVWLILFGLVHGYFLFVGDILWTYGVVGLLVLPARNWAVDRQLRVGVALLAVSCLVPGVLAVAYPWLPSWGLEGLNKLVTAQNVPLELSAFRADYLTQLPVRAELSFSNQILGTVSESGWRAAGCMMLGMAAVRSGFFKGKTPPHRWAFLHFVVGIALTALGIIIEYRGQFSPHAWCVGQAVHLLGTFGIALGILSGIIRASLSGIAHRVLTAVSQLGRLALSAYIMQSVVGMLVFAGHGLGQYGHWSRAQLFLAALCFWLFQVVLAQWWSRIFKTGPLEALLKALYTGSVFKRSLPQ